MLSSLFFNIRRTRFDQSSSVNPVSESRGGPLSVTKSKVRRTEILVSNFGCFYLHFLFSFLSFACNLWKRKTKNRQIWIKVKLISFIWFSIILIFRSGARIKSISKEAKSSVILSGSLQSTIRGCHRRKLNFLLPSTHSDKNENFKSCQVKQENVFFFI